MPWKAGQSGNPKGRPPGSRDRLTSALFDKLADDFKCNGKKAIQDCRKDDPAAYLRLIASLAPKEFAGEVTHNYVALMPAVADNAEEWQKQYAPTMH